MGYTKSQQMLIDDGLPASFIISQEERAAAWIKNPPKQSTWNTSNTKRKEQKMRIDFRTMDEQQLKHAYDDMVVEAVDLGLMDPVKFGAKKFKSKDIGIQKCEEIYKKICEAKGEAYSPLDYESEAPAEVPHKNSVDISKAKTTVKKPEKKPDKKKAPAKKLPDKKPNKDVVTEEHPLCVATGIRTNSLLGKIVMFLGARLGKMVAEKQIIMHLYNDERKSNRVEVLGKQMKRDKYDLRKEDKNGVVSYGLYAKK